MQRSCSRSQRGRWAMRRTRSGFSETLNAVLPVGLGALLAVNGAAVAAGNTLGGLVDAVQNGDPEAAFNAIVNRAAAATTALLNGALDPNFGLIAGLQGLREAIAAAITPPASTLRSVAKLPSAAAKSFTADRAARKGMPAPKAGHTIWRREDRVQSTPARRVGRRRRKTRPARQLRRDTKDNTKGGNLFTPGSHLHKGWQASRRHRQLRPRAAGHHQGAHRPRSRQEVRQGDVGRLRIEEWRKRFEQFRFRRFRLGRWQRKQVTTANNRSRIGPLPARQGADLYAGPIAASWPTRLRRRRCPRAPHPTG